MLTALPIRGEIPASLLCTSGQSREKPPKVPYQKAKEGPGPVHRVAFFSDSVDYDSVPTCDFMKHLLIAKLNYKEKAYLKNKWESILKCMQTH